MTTTPEITTEQTPEPTPEVVDEAGGSTELVERAREIVSAAPATRPDYRLAMEMGRAMAASGYFQDARSEAEAAVKMIIGLDLGISPTAAMTAIHIVRGKPMIGYQILAAKIVDHPDYRYKVADHDDERCVVEFYRADELLGVVEWTLERANEAQLVKADSGWAKYPRNMLIARCLSDGVKWYMPDLLTGAAVYVDDEIPADRRSLTPGAERAPQLADERAEGLRQRAKAAYDQLTELDTSVLPPGAFRKLLDDSGHSHTALEAAAEQVEDLRDRQAEINALRESIPEGRLKEVEPKLARLRSQREKIEYLTELAAKVEAEGEEGSDGDG